MRGISATVQRGEEKDAGNDALGAIYREFHQSLYRYCLAIVGNRQDAEDALQNTMIKVMRALPGERRSIALKPWLYRIAHNESIDLLRRRRQIAPLEAEQAPVGEELAAQVETRARLRQLIADLRVLPERQRQALLMREAAGLGFEDIAAALGTSAAVARQTLYEARLGLRQMEAGREMSCDGVARALSDGDGRVRRRRDVRAHLRDCAECRRFAAEIDSRRAALAAFSPLPAVAAGAILNGALAGGAAGSAAAGGAGGAAAIGAGGAAAGATGSGAGGLLGVAAIKSLGSATLMKGAATVAVVAAIGVGVADRGVLPDLSTGSGPSSPAQAAPAAVGSGAEAGEQSDPERSPDRRLRSPRGAGDSSRALERGRVGSGRVAAASGSEAPTTVVAKPVQHPPQPATNPSSGGPPVPAASDADPPSTAGQDHSAPAAAGHGRETAAGHRPEKPVKPVSAPDPQPVVRGKSAEAPASAAPEQSSESGRSPK